MTSEYIVKRITKTRVYIIKYSLLNDCKISIYLVDSSSVSYNLQTDRTIKSNKSAELLATGVSNSGFGSTDSSFAPGTPMVVKESEVLKVQAEHGGDLHVILSVLEIS